MKNELIFNLQRFGSPGSPAATPTASTGTTLADIVAVPSRFDAYVINKTAELSALLQSGIMVRDSHFDQLASEPAQVHNMPFFNDLTGDSEDVVEGTDLTADKIKSGSDASTTIRRAKMWSATDLSAALAGSDPAAAIASLVGDFWARDNQKELINILNGVFACDTMKDTHVLDISGGTGKAANFSAESFLDATQLLGDAQGQLTAVVMHSATKVALKKQNLIETIRNSDAQDFDTYMGRRVIVDDGCPHDAGVYTTYLFGQGAIAYGIGNPTGFVPVETDRDKKKGSGVNYLISRRAFIMHPRGVAWQNKTRAHAESVSRAELANKDNWKRVYEPKQVRIVAFKHKLG
jgi:phage coat protein|nr:MAG TPA: major capsid protein [Caudoviricetes sp.]DAY30830.1 MAG TPA: major capsid protein [Caudoviricetes sp.]